ncbi:MAG: hypothetical protein JZU53_07055 [Paludibacter sp.]|nr:hypothetical protein [Paludibacter sp.]
MNLEKTKNNVAEQVDDGYYKGEKFFYYSGSSTIVFVYDRTEPRGLVGTLYEDIKATKLHSYNYSGNEFVIENCYKNKLLKIVFEDEELLNDLADRSMNGENVLSEYMESVADVSENNEFALVSTKSKANLEGMKISAEIAEAKVRNIQRAVQMKIEQKKNEMDVIRRQFETQLAVIQKQMKRIGRVIGMIELYAGISEELVCLKEGANAPDDAPIYIRQMTIYMDEEYADYSDGGIDVNDIDKFNEWLISDAYKELLPNDKCVVSFRPRRYRKEYADARMTAQMELYNKMCFIYMRNGDNIYCVQTDYLYIIDQLIPSKDEAQKIQSKIDESNFKKYEQEAQEEFTYQYMRIGIFLQGILDRTEIFSPIPLGVSIFDVDNSNGFIKFLYDADNVLTNGMISFSDWKKQTSELICEGSRVLVVNPYSKKGYQDRLVRYYSSEWSVPDMPSTDIYTVGTTDYNPNSWKDKSKCLCIKYQPGGEVYSWGKYATERKNRLTFVIYTHDSFVFNYDQLDMNMIDYYLKDRVNRKNYLSMMPILKNIRKLLVVEQEKEQQFALMLQGETGKSIETILESINWWKYKNKWKRYINSDDAKAYRMIKSKLTK